MKIYGGLKIFVLWLFLFMSIVMFGSKVNAKSDLSAAQVTWWCHTKEDAIIVIQTPMQLFGPLMLALVAAGKCGGTFYDYHYVFYPSASHENYTAPNGDIYTVVQGIIMPKTNGGYEVFTGRSVKKEDSPPVNGKGTTPRNFPGHPGWEIKG